MIYGKSAHDPPLLWISYRPINPQNIQQAIDTYYYNTKQNGWSGPILLTYEFMLHTEVKFHDLAPEEQGYVYEWILSRD